MGVESLDEEGDLLMVHVEFFSSLVTYVLGFFLQTLDQDVNDFTTRRHNEVVKFPVRCVLVGRDGRVDLVVEQLGGNLHVLGDFFGLRLGDKLHDHERRGVRSAC